MKFDRPYGMGPTTSSKFNKFSSDLQVSNQVLQEADKYKSLQQPSVIRGSFTPIMVNLMQLQDHKFTAWLDRLVEARRNRQEK